MLETDADAAPGMKKVTVQRIERFVEPALPGEREPAAEQETADVRAEEEEEVRDECPYCEGSFRLSSFEENGGYCPGCQRDGVGDLKPSNRDVDSFLSEEEIALSEIEINEGKYKLRVERFVDYHINGHTDSRARKEFCTTIEPLTRDFLDRVSAAFGGGDYWFTVYERGRPGIAKAFHRSIAKPTLPNPEPPAPVPAQSITPTVDRLRSAVEKAVANRIERILDDPPAPPNPLPAAPPDENTILAHTLLTNPRVIDSIMDRVAAKIGGTEEPWHAPLVRQAVENLPQVITLLQTALSQKTGAAPPNGGNAAMTQSPKPEDQSPPVQYTPTPAQIAFLKLIRRVAADMDDSTDARDRETGEPIDVCDPTLAVDGTLRLIEKFPEYRAQINQVLIAPPSMLVAFIAQQCQDVSLVENPGSVVFAVEYQKLLREALAEPPEPESSQPGERPSAATAEAAQ